MVLPARQFQGPEMAEPGGGDMIDAGAIFRPVVLRAAQNDKIAVQA